VYWRRRLLLLCGITVLLILLVLTVKIAADGGTAPPRGAGHAGAGSTPAGRTTHVTHPPPRPSTTHTASSTTLSSPSAPHSSSSAAPQPCDPAHLKVSAVVGQRSYHVGDQPLLELQVTNPGPLPCVQDLADRQIELRVYNGESRVWGSHDCQIQPGTNPRTLAVNRPVRVAITWSGLTSQPNCAGTRQRVGAGTYTLYAVLSGHTGTATTFTIS
jgi:hypothetical protein